MTVARFCSASAIMYATLALIMALLFTGADATQCGDCDTLGFLCIPPEIVEYDLCGVAIDPTSCPISSCQAYCENVTEGDNNSNIVGTCSATTYTCVCEEGGSSAVVDPPAPDKETEEEGGDNSGSGSGSGSNDCEPLSCAALANALVCVPTTFIDVCSKTLVDPATCASEIPLCDTQCGTTNGASVCSVDGQSCICGTSTNGNSLPPSPSASAASTSDGTATALPPITVPDGATVYAVNGTVALGNGAIVGIVINSAMGLSLLSAVIGYYLMSMEHNAPAAIRSKGIIPYKASVSARV